jgi:hypothetical protein
LLNHTYNESIDDIPVNKLLGSTTDISVLLRFHWYQEVYYKLEDNGFPSDSREQKGHIVGIAEHVGHALTYRVFDPITRKIICRGDLRAAHPSSSNKRLDLLRGEDFDTPSKNSIIKSIREFDEASNDTEQTAPNGEPADGETSPLTEATFSPHDLVGRTFLLSNPDGTRPRARIIECIENQENELGRNPTRIKFKISVNGDEYEDLIAYNEVMEHIQEQDDDATLWKFRRIVSHQGPLNHTDQGYNGSKWNVMVEWENGEITSEPLNIIAADDPVTCAIYAKENNLLELEGWKRFKTIARRHKKYLRMVNQAKLRSYRSATKYMFGYEIPRDYSDAIRLDNENKNTRWQDCTALEMKQLADYDTFSDLGHATKVPIPDGYKRIRVHLVYAVKHDGRHKARLVADGHLTDVPLESVYSGVVSLRGFRLVVFLAELNGLELWATDIGNAYLEAKTREKLVIIAGEEFGELAGHLLVIQK